MTGHGQEREHGWAGTGCHGSAGIKSRCVEAFAPPMDVAVDTAADPPLDVSRSSSKTARTRRPPLVDRRHPNRICSLATLALLMCQLYMAFGGIGGDGAFGGVSAAPSLSTAVTMAPLKHLQKRSGVNFKATFQQLLNASSTHLDWENTCNSKPTGLVEKRNKTKRCKKRHMILQKLQRQTGRELRGLQVEDSQRTPVENMNTLARKNISALNIRKMKRYQFHMRNYTTFLPRLSNSSNQLNLRHVHRDLQHFVGTFTYLRNAKMHWDVVNLQARSVLADELGRLRKSARDMLCSVEDVINLTNLLYAPNPRKKLRHQKRRRQAQPVVTFRIQPRAVMEKWLNQFKSNPVELNQQATLAARGVDVPPPADSTDLANDALFAKFKFVQYMKSIRVILSRQRQRKGCRVSPTPKAVTPRSQIES
nr:uncharacterized protein LOC108060960 [Drosophila takahashii]